MTARTLLFSLSVTYVYNRPASYRTLPFSFPTHIAAIIPGVFHLRVSQLFTDLTHLFGLFIALVTRTYVLISVIIHR